MRVCVLKEQYALAVAKRAPANTQSHSAASSVTCGARGRENAKIPGACTVGSSLWSIQIARFTAD